jgi:ABC-type uncharacterized transport system permease subunit
MPSEWVQKKRTIMDHIIRLEQTVREGFLKKELLVAVFFHLSRHITLPGNMAS